MEVALQAHVSRSWRTTNLSEAQAGSLRFRLFHGNRASSTTSTTLSPLWFRGHLVAGRSFRIVASARQSDSSRKRSRKLSTAKLESSAPKGFKPKVPVGASTPKRDQSRDEEKEGSATLKSSAHTKPNQAAVKLKVGDEEDLAAKKVLQKDEDVQNKIGNDAESKSSLTSKSTSVDENNAAIDNGMAGRLSGIDRLQEKEEENEPGETVSDVLDNSEEDEPLKTEAKLTEESLKLKLEMEANAKRQEIEKLAEENFLGRIQVFVFPPVVKPDQNIELFFNRSLSILNGEQDILIMGAFNDWKWKSFTMRLNKANVVGDWWSCQIHVPKEAYKIDFVFLNGKDVYENNDGKDFCIYVEGGMDASTFEDFLLEEKRKELERLAKERDEREKQEEELKRIEAEKVASEADRAQAKVETEKRREMLKHLLKMAVKSVDNVWYIEPTRFQGGDSVRLYYNKRSGPLAHAEEIWIHGGHNNWTDGLSIVEMLVFAVTKDNCDWWYADVTVPDRALVLDWVLADGPPEKASIYDNNNRLDFHAIVPKAISEELYWVEEEQMIYRKLQEERRLREEAIRAKAERTARMKSETKERTMKNFLLSQKHIVFTDPVDVQAGSAVTVFYNPANTPLNGKPEVWFRCSFNRWSHRKGPLPPQKMLPVDGSSHVKATVKVPLDAYMMDFVFSEREDGGIFDNKNGMDYHIPVVGGINKEPPLHIVHIAVEMAPIAKVGGLGDVVTSLSRAIQDLNHNVDIVLPKYDCLNLSNPACFC